MSDLNLYDCCAHDGADADDDGERFQVRAATPERAIELAAAENESLGKPRTHLYVSDQAGTELFDDAVPSVSEISAPRI